MRYVNCGGVWGIRPSAVAGYSAGEIAAAWAAGALSMETALDLAAERGRLIQTLPDGGSMAAVFASLDRVRAALDETRGGVSLAGINSPDCLTVSGSESDVAAFLDAARSRTA